MLESLALAPPHWQRLGDAQQLLWIPKKTDNLCHETCLTVCRGGRSGAGETFTRSVFAIAFSGLSALFAHFLHGPELLSSGSGLCSFHRVGCCNRGRCNCRSVHQEAERIRENIEAHSISQALTLQFLPEIFLENF